MIEQSSKLPDHLQALVEAGVSGVDVMHGQLKIDMLEAEAQYTESQTIEDESGDAMDSMERKYNEGFLDALTYCYKLTYDISFAERTK
jgi:hypothetical protein